MNDVNYDKAWGTWGEMIDYSPAPMHRRRLIKQLMRGLKFKTVLDVGCGNGKLIDEIHKKFGVQVSGIDVSDLITRENRIRYKKHNFHCMDIQRTCLDEKFDLVICSELIEHLDNLEKAFDNLTKMTLRYLIVTTPAGAVFPIDNKMGHAKHLNKEHLIRMLEKNKFKILEFINWGFPFHTIYKYSINLFPFYFISTFAETRYGFCKKFFSFLLYCLFYLNCEKWGYQMVVLAEKQST